MDLFLMQFYWGAEVRTQPIWAPPHIQGDENPWNPARPPLTTAQGPERSLSGHGLRGTPHDCQLFFLLHHHVSLRPFERQFQDGGGCLFRALGVLRSLSEHGSNLLCEQADCGLGRFSKPAICTAALGPNLRRAPSQAPGLFFHSRCQKEPSVSEPCRPTHGEPWQRPRRSKATYHSVRGSSQEPRLLPTRGVL